MGNCLRVEQKVIRVMKMDGKVLEYQAPVNKVFQVSSDITGNAISDHSGSNHHLNSHTDLMGDHPYHLVPVQVRAPKKAVKKKVTFSLPAEAATGGEKEQEATEEDEKVAPATAKAIDQGFKIKIVITKAELRKMIQNGLVSVDKSMAAAAKLHLKKEEDHLLNCSDDDGLDSYDDGLDSYDDDYRSNGCLWKPSLVSIPEVNYHTVDTRTAW